MAMNFHMFAMEQTKACEHTHMSHATSKTVVHQHSASNEMMQTKNIAVWYSDLNHYKYVQRSPNRFSTRILPHFSTCYPFQNDAIKNKVGG